MLGIGRFGELIIVIKVDGVTMGGGSVSTAPNCNDDGLFPIFLG